jgi:hypothetical protein
MAGPTYPRSDQKTRPGPHETPSLVAALSAGYARLSSHSSPVVSVSTATEWLHDFLVFQVYLSPAVLLLTYYVGALLIPVLVYNMARRLHQRLTRDDWRVPDHYRKRLLARRGRVIGYAVLALLLGELTWRMMFEFLVAYFQMHEALTRMSGT